MEKDKNASNDEKVPVICPVCQGTGFGKPGEICPCVTGKHDGIEMPDILKDIFGGFDAKNN